MLIIDSYLRNIHFATIDFQVSTMKCYIVMLLGTLTYPGIVAIAREYYIHHQCRTGMCPNYRNFSCQNGATIHVEWSRIGYSTQWSTPPFGSNCKVTNDSCYKEVQEPANICNGLSSCTINGCSNYIHQVLFCIYTLGTNYVRINYTCIADYLSSTIWSVTDSETSSYTTPDLSTLDGYIGETSTQNAEETFLTEKSGMTTNNSANLGLTIGIAVLAVVVIILLVIITVCFVHRKNVKSLQGATNADTTNMGTIEDQHLTTDNAFSHAPVVLENNNRLSDDYEYIPNDGIHAQTSTDEHHNPDTTVIVTVSEPAYQPLSGDSSGVHSARGGNLTCTPGQQDDARARQYETLTDPVHYENNITPGNYENVSDSITHDAI